VVENMKDMEAMLRFLDAMHKGVIQQP